MSHANAITLCRNAYSYDPVELGACCLRAAACLVPRQAICRPPAPSLSRTKQMSALAPSGLSPYLSALDQRRAASSPHTLGISEILDTRADAQRLCSYRVAPALAESLKEVQA